MAQNTGSVWIYESLREHPLRTRDPSKASLFVVPVDAYVSVNLNQPCNGKLHEERSLDVVEALRASEHFRRHWGRDHMVACAWWGAAKSWGKWLAGPSIWKLLHKTAILATIDEYFSRDWNKVLITPYVHAAAPRGVPPRGQ